MTGETGRNLGGELTLSYPWHKRGLHLVVSRLRARIPQERETQIRIQMYCGEIGGGVQDNGNWLWVSMSVALGTKQVEEFRAGTQK